MLTPISVPTACFVSSLVGARGSSASNMIVPPVCFDVMRSIRSSLVPSVVRPVPSLCSPDVFSFSALKNSTTLASYVWEKNLSPNPDVEWEILDRAPTYPLGGKNCELCLTEKLHIARSLKNPMHLNKRGELAQRCRHKHSFLLQPPTRGGGDG